MMDVTTGQNMVSGEDKNVFTIIWLHDIIMFWKKLISLIIVLQNRRMKWKKQVGSHNYPDLSCLFPNHDFWHLSHSRWCWEDVLFLRRNPRGVPRKTLSLHWDWLILWVFSMVSSSDTSISSSRCINIPLNQTTKVPIDTRQKEMIEK